MKLGIVGGRLQGTEAAYLAGEAGYEVVLIDREPRVPAAGLADEVHVFDVRADEGLAERVLGRCDVVLPACEDEETLAWLATRVPVWGVPLIFDQQAYALSSSKIASDRFFAELDVPRPAPWPECGFPAVVKPSASSGSRDVYVARDAGELERARAAVVASGHDVVVQEFVEGPSLSLEVVGIDGTVQTLLPTLLEFDERYDCKRVVAPVELDRELLDRFHDVARLLGRGIALRGIMDVEVIEIDARLPSQTPSVVYHCCGVNIVALLVEDARGGNVPAAELRPGRAVVYQHVAVADGAVQVVGEHVLSFARPLSRIDGFYGATVALTDRVRGAEAWVATLIVEEVDVDSARHAADECVRCIAACDGLVELPESVPERMAATG